MLGAATAPSYAVIMTLQVKRVCILSHLFCIAWRCGIHRNDPHWACIVISWWTFTANMGWKGVDLFLQSGKQQILTIGAGAHAATQSGVFRDIIAPFSQKVANFLADTTRPAVAGCTPLGADGRPVPAAPAPAPVAPAAAAAVVTPVQPVSGRMGVTAAPIATPVAAAAAATQLPVDNSAATPLATPPPVAADAGTADTAPAAPAAAGAYAWGNAGGAPAAQTNAGPVATQTLSTVSTSAGRKLMQGAAAAAGAMAAAADAAAADSSSTGAEWSTATDLSAMPFASSVRGHCLRPTPWVATPCLY